ncbi:MAG: hypothetical protein AAFO99_14365, partial [Bacteroidota bacterium]
MGRIRNLFYKKDKEGKRLNLTLILLMSIVVVILTWGSTLIVLGLGETPGAIGDSFGMVNALFSALAFAFLIYTSLLQTEELKLQREELARNRIELERSAKAQSDLLNLQMTLNAELIEPRIEIDVPSWGEG